MKKVNSKGKISYDPKIDAFYIGIKSGAEEEFVELMPGVSIELDNKKNIIGIEILNASKIFKPVFKKITTFKTKRLAAG